MGRDKAPVLHKSGKGIAVSVADVFSYHTHMHSYYEMTLYEPFGGRITVNDKAFTIDRPTVVLVIPSDVHRIEVPEKAKAGFIKIAFDPDPALVGEGIGASVILQGLGEGDLLYKLFLEIAAAAEGSAYKTLLVHTALLALAEKGARVTPAKKQWRERAFQAGIADRQPQIRRKHIPAVGCRGAVRLPAVFVCRVQKKYRHHLYRAS